jgi:hypothetical protein
MKHFLSVIFIVLSIVAIGQDFSGPESVAYYPQQNVYLVSNANNGTISKVDMSSGTMQVSILCSSGLTFPRGLKIVGDTLYVADLTYIRLINLNTGNVFASIEAVGSQSLNDVELASDYLYLSDNQNHKIYKYRYSNREMTDAYSDSQIQNPNGLFYDSVLNRLILVSFRTNSPVQAIDLGSGTVSNIVTSSYSNMDGICRDASGNYYISYWGSNFTSGKIVKYTPDFIDPVVFAQNLNGPADILSDDVNHKIVVPVMSANTLDFFSLCNVQTGNISGFDEANINDEVIYSVTPASGSNYSWSVNGGQILSGNGTSTIHIQWTVAGTGVVTVVETNDENCVGESVFFNVNVSLSDIDNHLIPYDFTIFPNPSKGNFAAGFHLDEFADVQLSLLDNNGGMMKTLKTTSLNPGSHCFNFNVKEFGIQKGVYFLRTQVNNVIFIKRIVFVN